VVSVTIFEAEPGGLFVPSDAGARPGNFVTLPDQVVDTNGTITVPYAGKIRAVGRTPAEVQDAISEALRAHVDRRSTQLVAAPPSTRKRRPAIEAFNTPVKAWRISLYVSLFRRCKWREHQVLPQCRSRHF
jgi:hypothetical protein